MLNKTHSLKHFAYLVGLHIYYKMIHGPYNVKLVLEYVENMPSGTKSHYKVNKLPEVNRLTATKVQIHTVQTFFRMWSSTIPLFWKRNVHYRVGITVRL